MIRVLIVEDSPTVTMLLKALLDSDPEIQVIGTAANGDEGVQQALALRPDLITMDIRMPIMDGFEATQRIMEACPTPIVVVSSNVESADLPITFNAIRAGALDVVEKPAGIGHADFETIRDRLLIAVKLMAEVKVIRRHRARNVRTAIAPPEPYLRKPPAILAIGASTGGPVALNTLLRELPSDFVLPVVVVQHMAAGFTQGLIEWLQLESQLPLKIARNDQRIYPGEVYFAPDGYHLELCNRTMLRLGQTPPVSFARPSVTVLFESVAHIYGVEAVGILLTGMGDDGAAGLKAIRDRGGLTLVQDEATSVVYGMPAVAVKLGAADYVLPLDRIVPTLIELVQVRR